MRHVVFLEDVVNVIQSFCMLNEGDDATTALILSIGAQLLDIFTNEMYELIGLEVADEN